MCFVFVPVRGACCNFRRQKPGISEVVELERQRTATIALSKVIATYTNEMFPFAWSAAKDSKAAGQAIECLTTITDPKQTPHTRYTLAVARSGRQGRRGRIG